MRQDDHNRGQGPPELRKIGQPGQVSGNFSQNQQIIRRKEMRERRKVERALGRDPFDLCLQSSACC